MNLKGRKIFLTGGDGFIGSALVMRLCRDNDVVIYDIGERGALKFTDASGTKRCRFVKADVLDADALRKASKGCSIVIHMAAIAGVSQYYSRPIRTLEVNIVGTLNVLRAALENKAEKFIYCSTSEIYGPDAYDVNEESPTSQGPATQSRWTYSVGKLAGEHLAMSFFREKKLPVVSLRPFNIYGPRQIHPCAVQIMALKAVAGEDITVHGDGSQVRAWCYVEDYVDATVLAVENDKASGQLFNIGNPKATLTILELAKKIRDAADSKSNIVFKENPYVDVRERKPDTSKAKEVLGFEAKTGIDDGLRKTVSWYRENADAFRGR
jgi:nucleoside-diphosphate-sugar epimerase